MAARKKGPTTPSAPADEAPASPAKAATAAAGKAAAKRSRPVNASPATPELPLEASQSKAAQAVLRAADAAVEANTSPSPSYPAGHLFGAGAESAREAFARAEAASAEIRARVAATASTTTQGAMELNGKVIEAWRAQGEIAMDLWRQTLQSRSLSDAVRLQASGVRQSYETAIAHWREVAEATTRLVGAAVPPSDAR